MDLRCKKCGIKIDFVDVDLCPNCKKEIHELIELIYSTQPEKNRAIDQFGLHKDSILTQTLYLHNSFRGNTSALFGGYDGIGLLSPFFGQKKIVVIDLDPRVLEWWRKVGADFDFEVSTYEYDAHSPISAEMVKSVNEDKIDFWRTDPPFNCAGMFCFFNRILYLDINKAPLYLTIPVNSKWTQLLKHQIFEFKQKNKITGVSPDINKYKDPDGPDSVLYEFEAESPIFPNIPFTFDTTRPSVEFSDSEYGCHMYERCKHWRNEWDLEINGGVKK